VDKEGYGSAQVGEEKVEGELMMARQTITLQRAQVEDDCDNDNYLTRIPVVDKEGYGSAQVREEKVEGELMMARQAITPQRAQVEDEEAEGNHHALAHLHGRERAVLYLGFI
jgi:hypothetical protein